MTIKTIYIKKYPNYKDAGVEWLGEIPEHWEVIRMKRLFAEISEKNREDEELLSVTQSQGVVPRTWVKTRMVMPSGNLHSFKFIKKGDFAISLRSFEGGLEYCYHNGIISPAYTVLRIKENLHNLFYKFLFKSHSFISELQTSVVGIREGKNISYPELSYSFLPIPPFKEQTKIAQFLDQKTTQIDQAITQKEQLIQLLKEHRKIMIQQAVTKGLNPDVPMKDSGVEWIGEIPEHWEVKRAKYVFNEVNERSINGNEELLSVSHMTGVTPRSEKNIYMFKAENYSGSKLCKKGDLVINTMWAWMGALGVSDRAGIVSPSYGVYRQQKNTFNSWFLEHLLKNINYVAQYNRVSTGLHWSRLRLYPDMFFKMEIGIPPRNEQDFIEKEINVLLEKIDKGISLVEEKIQALKEYKSTLINSAVTGKIKI